MEDQREVVVLSGDADRDRQVWRRPGLGPALRSGGDRGAGGGQPGRRGAHRCRPRRVRERDPHRGPRHVPVAGWRRSTAASRSRRRPSPLNRLCGSGLQAIVSAAQAIKLGDCDVAVAGGAESMSRGQYWLPGMRWGQRMQDGVVVDADGRRADRPVRRLPYGRDGRERRQRVQRVQGGPGRARGGEPPAGRRGHRGRVLQRADHCRSRCKAGRARSPLTPTSTSGPA